MKIGFFGAGNMASAIVGGAVSSGNFKAEDISVYDIDNTKARLLSDEFSVCVSETPDSLIDFADAVVLAVKPNIFPTLLPSISKKLRENNSLVVSIAAGKTTEFIEKLLGFKAPVIRIMPNINATVLEAISAYCCSESVTDEQKEFANKLCSSFGKVMPLPESYFPLFCSIAGCAPAYAYMFIDSLARSAVKNGMNKSVALEIAAQTVLGSAKKILESDEHPWELIDKVCSPGGTTIEGIVSLQKDGFESAVCNAVDAALQKDKKV